MTSILNVNIVDDDDDSREECELLVTERGWNPKAIEGRFRDDLDGLVAAAANNASLVICDHRLTMGDLSSRSGAQVASCLYELRIPTFLVTTYLEPELPRLRRYGRRLPVVLSREDFSVGVLGDLYQRCVEEFAQGPQGQRCPYRALIDVLAVDGTGMDKVIEALIPAWNPHRAVIFSLQSDDLPIAHDIVPGVRLFGEVNLDATDPALLYVDRLVLAPKPDSRLV